MKRILPLVLIIVLANAEEATPPPAPAAGDGTAPQSEVESPRPQRRAGTRVARVAGAAPEWDGRVRVGTGWDSNALLDSDPDTVQADTAVHSAEAGLGWRPIADERDYLKATASLGHDVRPHLADLDTTRLALGLAGARQAEDLTWGGSINAARYWLDGDGAAAELRGGVSANWLRGDSADLVAVELAAIHFDAVGDRPEGAAALGSLGEADDRSGTLAALAWRHWWQLGGGGRVEAGVRAGRFAANAEVENYSLLQPWLALRLRPEGWDVNARLGLEGRAYGGERTAGGGAENAALAGLTVAADRRVPGVAGLWAGAFAGVSARDSNYQDRDYERWQAGLRLTWTFSDEE